MIPWLERFPVEGNGNPLQYTCLENSLDGGAWQATVHEGCKVDMIEQPTLSLSQKKKSCIALPGKGSHSKLMPSKLCVPTRRCSEKFYTNERAGCGQLTDTVLIGW